MPPDKQIIKYEEYKQDKTLYNVTEIQASTGNEIINSIRFHTESKPMHG